MLGAGIDIFREYADAKRRKEEIEVERAIQEQEDARLKEAEREIEIARKEERDARRQFIKEERTKQKQEAKINEDILEDNLYPKTKDYKDL